MGSNPQTQQSPPPGDALLATRRRRLPSQAEQERRKEWGATWESKRRAAEAERLAKEAR